MIIRQNASPASGVTDAPTVKSGPAPGTGTPCLRPIDEGGVATERTKRTSAGDRVTVASLLTRAGPTVRGCRPGNHESSCVRSHGKESWFSCSTLPSDAS